MMYFLDSGSFPPRSTIVIWRGCAGRGRGLASSFDLFRVSTIEFAEEILTASALESAEDVIAFDDLFDSHVGIIEGASDFVDPLLSFDVLSGFVSRFDIVSDVSSMDLSIF